MKNLLRFEQIDFILLNALLWITFYFCSFCSEDYAQHISPCVPGCVWFFLVLYIIWYVFCNYEIATFYVSDFFFAHFQILIKV